jgi:formylglycine-generating enzyme required for sulfatase activity
MIGNTWEWTAGTPDALVVIKGGCATSPMEHCDPAWESKWLADKTQEYIGFRCCYPIRRFA